MVFFSKVPLVLNNGYDIMGKGKTRARELILTSGFSWLFLLSIARSHKILKLEPTLEEYIFGIAKQPLYGMECFIFLLAVFIPSFIMADLSFFFIISMTAIYTLMVMPIVIYNGMKTNLSVIETMKMSYLHIRKIIFIRH